MPNQRITSPLRAYAPAGSDLKTPPKAILRLAVSHSRPAQPLPIGGRDRGPDRIIPGSVGIISNSQQGCEFYRKDMAESNNRTVTQTMFNPSPHDRSKESDADYFARRAREEEQASSTASDLNAADVHRILGLKYQRLATQKAPASGAEVRPLCNPLPVAWLLPRATYQFVDPCR